MKFDPQKHHRNSIRLKEYDYTQTGAYFITVVTFQREPLFGEIIDGEMELNRRGEIVREEWFASANIRKEIRLFPEEFVVMPDHIHGIVWIEDVRADGVRPFCPPLHHPPLYRKPRSLGSLVAGFKSAVTKRIRIEPPALSAVEGDETGIWQRNYYDRIIRNERELDAIRKYIETNPLNWQNDHENPTSS